MPWTTPQKDGHEDVRNFLRAHLNILENEKFGLDFCSKSTLFQFYFKKKYFKLCSNKNDKFGFFKNDHFLILKNVKFQPKASRFIKEKKGQADAEAESCVSTFYLIIKRCDFKNWWYFL